MAPSEPDRILCRALPGLGSDLHRAARSPAPLTPHGAAVSRLRAPCQTRARYLTPARGHSASPLWPDLGEPGAGALEAAVSPELPPEQPRPHGLYATLARDESRRATTALSVHGAGVEAASPSRRRRRGRALRRAPGEGGLGGLGLGGRPPPSAAPQQCRARSALLRTPVCLLLPPFAQPSGLGGARRVRSLESGELPAGSARLGGAQRGSTRLGCGVRGRGAGGCRSSEEGHAASLTLRPLPPGRSMPPDSWYSCPCFKW